MTTFTYTIEDMHCENCAEKIKNALENQPGVEDLQIEIANKTITVSGEIAPEAVTSSLEEIGFNPKPIGY